MAGGITIHIHVWLCPKGRKSSAEEPRFRGSHGTLIALQVLYSFRITIDKSLYSIRPDHSINGPSVSVFYFPNPMECSHSRKLIFSRA